MMVEILSNSTASTKYIKAIVIHLDPFESKILFEQNFNHNEVNEVKKILNKYDYGDNICQAYEMSVEI